MCGICGVASLEGPIDPAVGASVRAMADAMYHRGPDSDGFHESETAVLGFRRLAIIDRAGGAPADGATKTGRAGSSSTARSTTTASCGRCSRPRGTGSGPSPTPKPSCTPRRNSARRASSGSRACSRSRSTTRGGSELFAARDRLGKKPLFYTVLDGVLHFASELQRCRAARAGAAIVDLSRSKATCRSATSSRRDDLSRRLQAACPATGCASRTAGSRRSRYWDVTEFDTDHRATRTAARRDIDETLREAVHDRLESEVPLGAFSQRRHRLGPGRVVHGRGARRSPCHDLGRIRRRRAQRARRGRESPREPVTPLTTRRSRARPRRGVRLARRRTRRAAGGLVGHSHVVRVAHGKAARHRRAQRRRRRRDVCRIRLPLRAARARSEGPRFRSRRAGSRDGGAVGRAWPRSPGLPKWLRAGTVLENLGRDSATAYYADLCFLKPGATRAGSWAAAATIPPTARYMPP